MLRVVQAFGDHVVGDSITDPAACEAVLASDQVAFVVAVPDPAPGQTKPGKPDTASAS
jgi:hypothetical protein